MKNDLSQKDLNVSANGEKIKGLEREIQSLLSLGQTVQGEKNSLNKEVSRLKEELVSIEDLKEKALEQKKSGYTEKISILEKKHKQEILALNDQKYNLKTLLEETKQKVNDRIKQSKTPLVKQIEQLKNDLSQKSSEVQGGIKKIGNLEKEMQLLVNRNQMKEHEKKSLIEKNDYLKNESNLAKKSYASNLEQVENGFDQKFAILEEAYQQEIVKSNEARAKNKQFQTKLDQLSKKFEKKDRESRKNLQAQVEVERRLTQLKESLEQRTKRIRLPLDKKIALLDDDLQGKSNQLLKTQSKLDFFKQKIENLTAQLDEQDLYVKKLNSDIKNLQAEKVSQDSGFESKLTQNISDWKSKLDQSNNEFKVLKQDFNRLQTDKSQTNLLNKELTNKLKESKKNISSLTREFQENDQNFRKKISLVEDVLQKKLDFQKEENLRQKNSINSQILKAKSPLLDEISSLKRNLIFEKNSFDQKQNEIKLQWQNKLLDLDRQLSEQRLRLGVVKGDLQKSNLNHKNAMDTLTSYKDENRVLNEQFQSAVADKKLLASSVESKVLEAASILKGKVKSFEIKLKNANSTIAQRLSEIQNFKKVIAEGKQTQRSSEDRIAALGNDLDVYRQRYADMNRNLTEATKERDFILKDFTQQEKQLKDLNQEKSSLKIKLDELLNQITTIKEGDSLKMNDQQKVLQNKINFLQKANNEFKKVSQEDNRRIKDTFTQKLESLKVKNSDLSRSMLERDKFIKVEKNRNQKLNDDYDRIAKENRDLVDNLTAFKEKTVQLEVRLKEESAKIKLVNTEDLTHLEKSFRDSQKSNTDKEIIINELIEEKNSMEGEIGQLELINKALDGQVENLLTDLKKSDQNQMNALLLAKKPLEIEIRGLKDQIKKVKNDMKSKRTSASSSIAKELKGVRDQIQEVRKSEKLKEDRIKTVSLKFENVQKRLSKVVVERNQFSDQIKKLNTQSVEWEKNLSAKVYETKLPLTEKIEHLEKKIVQLQKDSKNQFADKLKKLKKENEVVAKELRKFQSKTTEDRVLFENLKNQKETINGQLLVLMKERTSLQEAVYALTEELEATRQKYEQKIKSEEEKNLLLEQSVPTHETLIQDLKNELNQALELIETP